MSKEQLQQRKRNVPHAWWDKRVLRLFRKYFSKKDASNLSRIYLVLCEIDSDFNSKFVGSLMRTCETYSGANKRLVLKYTQLLRELWLIDYQRQNGKEGSTTLKLFEFNRKIHEQRCREVTGCTTTPEQGVHFSPRVQKYTRFKNCTTGVVQSVFGGNVYSLRSYTFPFPKTLRGIIDSSVTLSCESVHENSLSPPCFKEVDSLEPGKGDSLGKGKGNSLARRKWDSKRKQPAAKNIPETRKNIPIEKNKKITPASLSKWLSHHNLSSHKYDRPLIYMRTKLFEKKIQPAGEETYRILEHWNSKASKYNKKADRTKRVPIHRIKDSAVVYKSQIAITYLLIFRNCTEELIKKAIDNYFYILYSSPWYDTVYPFPGFVANRRLLHDCINGNVRKNRKYFPQVVQKKVKDIPAKELFEYRMAEFIRKEGRKPTEAEKLVLWNDIQIEKNGGILNAG